jgi:hypothetical protein
MTLNASTYQSEQYLFVLPCATDCCAVLLADSTSSETSLRPIRCCFICDEQSVLVNLSLARACAEQLPCHQGASASISTP